MATPDRPWILGLRPKKAGAAWQPFVHSILLRTFVTEPNGPNTTATETALGFAPCVYFYVFQTSGRFGSVVFLWRENPVQSLKAADGAVAPFDTGGIWHKRVIMQPPLPEPARKTFVKMHSRPVDQWLQEFVAWIAANYGKTSEYVEGKPPRAGVGGIVYDSRNEDGGWTWEARLEKASWREQISVDHIFWSLEDRRSFEDWLIYESDVDTKVADELVELIRTISIETPRYEQANVEVARYLMRIA